MSLRVWGGIYVYIQGIVLAGGKSTRMGTNKALLSLHNKRVIEHIIEEIKKITPDIIIISNEPKLYESYGYPIYKDRYKDKGPLAGLESALYHMRGDVAVVSPCDTPFIQHAVYEELLNNMDHYDAVVPKYNGWLHPLSSVYRRSIHPFIETCIQNNQLQVRSFFDTIHVHYQEDLSMIESSLLDKHFFNMNTMEQFNEAKRR